MSTTLRTTLMLVLLLAVAAVIGVWVTHSHRPAASVTHAVSGASSAPAGQAEPSSPTPSVAPPVAAAPSNPAPQPDLVLLAGSAFDDCPPPAQPADPPAGEHATRAQMLASQKGAKDFDTATNVYLACLDQAARNFDAQYRRLLTVANLRQIQAMQIRMHNAAVDVDHAVADRFNRQLHIFLARGHT